MKIYHRPDVDYLSLDFTDEPEAKSIYQDGLILRYNKKGHVIGLDITDSLKFFMTDDLVEMSDAALILGVSISTVRRMIKSKKIKATKPNGKDYKFKKQDLILYKKGA